MRFAWLLVLLVVTTMSGCSGCVEEKSTPTDKPSVDRGPVGAQKTRLVRPMITVPGDDAGAVPAPAPVNGER